MRLIDLDELDIPGKSIMMKVLEKWEAEHPLTVLKIPYGEGYVVTIEKTGAKTP